MKTPLLDGIQKEALSPATLYKLKEGLSSGGMNAAMLPAILAPTGAAIGTIWGALADPREGEDRRQTIKRHLLRGLAAGAVIPAAAGALGGGIYGWKTAIPNLKRVASRLTTGFPSERTEAKDALKVLKSIGIGL